MPQSYKVYLKNPGEEPEEVLALVMLTSGLFEDEAAEILHDCREGHSIEVWKGLDLGEAFRVAGRYEELGATVTCE